MFLETSVARNGPNHNQSQWFAGEFIDVCRRQHTRLGVSQYNCMTLKLQLALRVFGTWPHTVYTLVEAGRPFTHRSSMTLADRTLEASELSPVCINRKRARRRALHRFNVFLIRDYFLLSVCVKHHQFKHLCLEKILNVFLDYILMIIFIFINKIMFWVFFISYHK